MKTTVNYSLKEIESINKMIKELKKSPTIIHYPIDKFRKDYNVSNDISDDLLLKMINKGTFKI